MSNIKKLITVRCVENHEFELGDPEGKIVKAGYLSCPQMGCLRNGFVVDVVTELRVSTEDDMTHLDQADVCEICGRPLL